MSHVCFHCGGKVWFWNGYARVWCGDCGSTGRLRPAEERKPHGPGGPHDPAKDR